MNEPERPAAKSCSMGHICAAHLSYIFNIRQKMVHTPFRWAQRVNQGEKGNMLLLNLVPDVD